MSMLCSRNMIPSLSLAVAGLALGACTDSDSPTSPLAANRTALVRAIHLSPDAPLVDVWVDGSVVLQDLPYPVQSQYLEVPAGSHRVQVTPANASAPVVIDVTTTLSGGTAYSLAATGLLGDGSLAALPLVDTLTTKSGQVQVRFVHTSPDAPAVDVAVTGGPVLFTNVSYRQASSYATVEPGTYNLEVRVAGTQTVALRVPGVALSANTNLTIFAIGRLADGTLAARPVSDSR